ncbi:hypothetical protein KCU93_g458, partial [Aureobasidium melanogenum]
MQHSTNSNYACIAALPRELPTPTFLAKIYKVYQNSLDKSIENDDVGASKVKCVSHLKMQYYDIENFPYSYLGLLAGCSIVESHFTVLAVSELLTTNTIFHQPLVKSDD